ncbi:MAG: helix-turn-helix domain-containing protein [Atopobiaceae bacterium]|nr:helix-turn-helix domain-containing protein [Atopobiaceae bacterium]
MEAIKANVDNYVDAHATTKDALAKAIHISRSSFYDKLKGKRPWMLEEVINLAAFMGCSVNDLLTVPESATSMA